jgi:hypothetical protein
MLGLVLVSKFGILITADQVRECIRHVEQQGLNLADLFHSAILDQDN